MPKFKVLITETTQKVYEVKAKTQAAALEVAKSRAPVDVKKRYYQSVY